MSDFQTHPLDETPPQPNTTTNTHAHQTEQTDTHHTHHDKTDNATPHPTNDDEQPYPEQQLDADAMAAAAFIDPLADPSTIAPQDYTEDETFVPSDNRPVVRVAALSVRQPFASLILYGIKQLEARGRPMLRHVQGPIAIQVSQREEPYDSPLIASCIAILRRRYNDDTIASFFQLPPEMAKGHGCVIGLVDVESTWHSDTFTEIERAQLTEQAVFPAQSTFLTQLRNPRLLKYPVRCPGSNRLFEASIPLDALPAGSELDENGNLAGVGYSKQLARAHASGAMGPHASIEGGDDMGLGLLGGDFVRQLAQGDPANEVEKKRKKLQKYLRQIEELEAKRDAGATLEKTQEEKISRKEQLAAELEQLNADAEAAAEDKAEVPAVAVEPPPPLPDFVAPAL